MESDFVNILQKLLNGLRTGAHVKVVPVEGKRILRISWLNVVHEPEVFRAIARLVKIHAAKMGYDADAVASVETSGAKYGLALANELGKPYFSIHKAKKLIFQQPVTAEGFSVTESKPVTLHLDKAVASQFRNVFLIDDVRRTSTTINTAADLLNECGAQVTACYVIIDLAFAGHPRPVKVPRDRYHPLFVISSVDDDGRCVVEEGLVPEFL
ncbi:adenine phosphoribosyltransferase [Candidatus Caldarchaeum subterraneum]|uniref:Adenine phosphoribosyltransferase n=1 Tax=Caldiarchaeum subterraneum TaxID=311458 RepID=E6N4L0_CALS0|nr:adenine phosphoribosyltransferase [Candidatus Caldarchaeum subterraneum]BAJ47313.1 adenine phosphoribosyltransferase [Candidatus Caldarchaeum subterraneum]BAJ50105.1 adenine phosphoribosyltransferase [Candidatus Caldarchaeum subterraneum]